MNLIISNNTQGTQEWLNDRLGKATGSKASIIISKGRTKGTESITRRNYKYQLAIERITNVCGELEFTNRHIERGKELENIARRVYEIQTRKMVEEIGFCYPENEWYGCSVDGLIDHDGIQEIKCPIPAIHYSYIENNQLPEEYLPQVLHNLYTTGRQYCDFVSYNETMPDKLKLFVVRFEPNEAQLAQYKEQLFIFLEEVNKLTSEIQEKSND